MEQPCPHPTLVLPHYLLHNQVQVCASSALRNSNKDMIWNVRLQRYHPAITANFVSKTKEIHPINHTFDKSIITGRGVTSSCYYFVFIYYYLDNSKPFARLFNHKIAGLLTIWHSHQVVQFYFNGRRQNQKLTVIWKGSRISDQMTSPKTNHKYSEPMFLRFLCSIWYSDANRSRSAGKWSLKRFNISDRQTGFSFLSIHLYWK